MKSWKQVPKIDSVSKYVECYWYLEKESHDQSHTSPKLNPDPSCHLIISNSNFTHRYDCDIESQSIQGNHWLFPHRKTFAMDHSSPFTIIGIKFRIGALYSSKRPNLAVALDKVESVCSSQLLGRKLIEANQLLTNTLENKEEIGDALDELLSEWMLKFVEDKNSKIVRRVLPLLENTSITEIGGMLHCSQRTIERSFLKVTGLTMKQCQSMIRLEEILNYLYQRDIGNIDWSHVASLYNFSDQPHLIRHLKNSIGSTPAEYVRNRDLTIDIYGDFEFN
ncbi:MAG: helix-turn-helix domain-containing protein [Kangiellaceae bacterium]|nr:helix-turn-helix domain-containing protein [Kangiellaceae bacterium]